MTDGNDLELSFSKTLKETDLTELTADITDKALEAAGNVPIVGNLYKMFTVAQNVSTYFYVKKIYKFLFELKDVPIEKRREQLAKLEVLTDEREKVGEAVLLLLDKLNTMNKATMMGKAFKAYLEERISPEDLQSLNYAIEQLNCANIPCLLAVYDCHNVRIGYVNEIDNTFVFAEYGYTTLHHLAICGLLEMFFGEEKVHGFGPHNISSGQAVGGYRTNKLGKMFIEIILGVSLDETTS